MGCVALIPTAVSWVGDVQIGSNVGSLDSISISQSKNNVKDAFKQTIDNNVSSQAGEFII